MTSSVQKKIEIQPLNSPLNHSVAVPGSKSYTNRAVLIAALAEGRTVLEHALICEDTELIAGGVQQFGRARVAIDRDSERMTVERGPGQMMAAKEPVFVGNAGTPIRFLISFASLANGTSEVTGNQRMQERPCQDLVDALLQLGVKADVVRGTGCPPVRIEGPSLGGGKAKIRGSVSSQFTSSILLNAPYAEQDVELEITDDLCSKPYVDMTLGIMKEFGVTVERDGYRSFRVRHGQRYQARSYRIEPDASNMSYFLAAAAILGGKVRIPGINSGSLQGDAKFVDVLERMGCQIERGDDYFAVEGGHLSGVDVDMNWMPDLVPTLAVVAAYAEGRTHITNIANLRIKECDRIAALETELRKLGIRAESTQDTLTVYGGQPHGATVETYNDHRIAMCFAIAGLRTRGVIIEDPGCTAKSFPTFWSVLDTLR
ncbi:MAG TPA: 3-phosphoshikimate 1-carboxyvinyltransferase [Blastocatellia bacterium]|nr:3-phosphoshikimate 1-carboxyvinyltransferase [Blastocatellia bacterium]